MLQVIPLSWEAVFMLPAKLRNSDLLETLGKPLEALAAAKLHPGQSWEVRDKGELIGAFGYTTQLNTIWSLWADLTRAQAREIFDQTPNWTDWMLELSGADFLHNYVHVENKVAIKWLEHSGSFAIDKAVPYRLNDLDFWYFRTKLRGAS